MIGSDIMRILCFHKLTGLWCTIFVLMAFGCRNKAPDPSMIKHQSILNEKLSQLESVNNNRLDSVRGSIGKDDIAMRYKFYNLKFNYFLKSPDSLNHYADSAMLLFKDEETINNNKSTYFSSLLLKGDALYLSTKYHQAVLNYLEARAFREKNLDICYNKMLSKRIGNVYFVQSNFLKAASYYKESLLLNKKCIEKGSDIEIYYETQGLLNNIGYCYEKKGMLDSANFFYQKDLSYIDSLRATKSIAANHLDNGATIVYDNLGSLYLKKDSLNLAENFLLKSVSTIYDGGEDVKIPPTIKLATLYTLKKQYTKANPYFKHATLLLQKYRNVEFECRLQKALADFYKGQNNSVLALYHVQKYIDLKDDLESDKTKLSSIDIEKDFYNLEQKYQLKNLTKKDEVKTNYLILTGFLLFFVIIIATLFKLNINQAKRTSKVMKLNNQELQETLLRLEFSNQNYAKLMKVMAHDLKNPIGGIHSLSSMLLESESNPSDLETINIIKSASANAINIIDEILNSVSKSQADKDFFKTNVNIQPLIDECVSLLSIKATEKRQKIILKNNNDVVVHANKEKLWRVFNNIITNAIKFSHQDTEILLSVSTEESSVVISVEDHGIGIPEEFEDKIFDTFTSTKRAGTAGEKSFGLGLSISKQIIEAHNGRLWFENNSYGGTTFYIQLPTIA